MKKILFKGIVSFTLCLMLFALCSYAALPGKINYQGKLKENGEPVNGTKKMEFKIYNVATGEIPLWTSDPQNVLISNGLFNYQLGSNKPLSDIKWEEQSYYLEIMVEGVTLIPREELTGVAYSLSAARACALSAPDGSPKDAVYVDNDGNVGIGTTSLEDVTSDADITITGTIYQEDWKTPDLLNGWMRHGVDYNPAGYFRDKNGIVHLRGLVINGSSEIIFILPLGYRPSYREIHSVISDDIIGRIDILSNGQVLKVKGSNGWISLDGITFRADGF